MAPADCTPLTARICLPKSGSDAWTTITPIRSYEATTVPPASVIALFTDARVRWSVLVFTTYASAPASAVAEPAVAARESAGAADAAPGRKPRDAVSARPSGRVSASRRLERR